MIDILLKSGTFRRVVAFVITALAVLLNKKIGLQLDPGEVTNLVYMAITYIVASNGKEIADLLTQAKSAGQLVAPSDATASPVAVVKPGGGK